jgi:Immunity protein 50
MAKVRNSGALEDIFGYWPSFHDAEVVQVRLDRGDSLDAEGERRKASLEADIHVFEMTDEVTEQGFYALRNHTLATFAFHGIDEVQLDGFNHQNVLFGLRLEDISDRQLEVLKWNVGFDSSFGLAATFMCEEIEVLRAVPFEPPGHMTGTQLPPSPAP